ncbi:uncharacterized protein LOC128033834 [Gossypium raimondii]|uniref:uncharacterized protein LOC128033834 n=1 Tax=Gossypium raimondii TaxID=29730 RepID=UPI00227A90D5|nr:uncharacterized protein LOC128033834 [Gossypium raimondii]
MSKYPIDEKTYRRFQTSWFKLFPEWLKYSPSKDVAFCHPCYLLNKLSGCAGSRSFIIDGFRSWKKVNDGENCVLLSHIGNDPNSLHKKAIMQSRDLINQAQHILHVIEKQTSQEVANNRLILKTSIDVVRWLTFQTCSLRGHNERTSSTNRGNFLELIKLLAFYNERVASVVLDNAPQNASYTSHSVQKEILHIFAKKIRCFICEEIGELKFCIIVDVARDESKREQMANVLRSRSISSSKGSNYNGASLSYRLFYATIDSQLQELNEKFKEDMAELLMLCSALDPREDNKSFNIDNICKLAKRFYPKDFAKQEKLHLRCQLEHFELDIRQHTTF